jgi:hypothetical protein
MRDRLVGAQVPGHVAIFRATGIKYQTSGGALIGNFGYSYDKQRPRSQPDRQPGPRHHSQHRTTVHLRRC